MEKVVKLVILTSKEILVSEIEEVGAEVGEPDCKLLHPVILKTTEEKITVEEGKVLLTPWIIFSKDDRMPVPKDWIVTVVEPITSITELYESKVNEQNSQTYSSDEQRNLSE